MEFALLAVVVGDSFVLGHARAHADPEAITVDCRLFLGSDGGWGGSASRSCERQQSDRLILVGVVATATGLAATLLVAAARRGGAHVRLAKFLGGALLAVGLPALVFGALIEPQHPVRRTADIEHVVDALGPDGVIGSFDLVEAVPTPGGSRLNDELWVVVDDDVEAVRGALVLGGWSLEPVPDEFSDGWVALRGTAITDTVEVGPLADALGERADVLANSSRLLASIGSGATGTVIHIQPPTPRLGGGNR